MSSNLFFLYKFCLKIQIIANYKLLGTYLSKYNCIFIAIFLNDQKIIMKHLVKISIIIPAYNAAKYIEKCIISLLNQNIPYNEYEIIVINDGSTDDTLHIIQTLSNTYPQVKCISTPNQGVSASRNRGIKQATGTIILFVDADDFVEPNSLEVIYNTMQDYNLDLLLLDYNYWNVKGKQIEGFDHKELRQCTQKIISGKEFLLNKYIPSTVWIIAYRKSYLLKYNFQFINIRHEDEEFIPRVLYYAERIKYFPLKFYNYIQSDSSFMQNYKESALFDRIKAMASLNIFTTNNVKESDIRFCLEEHISQRLMENFKMSFTLKSHAQKEIINIMKQNKLTPLKRAKRDGFHSFLYKYLPNLFIAYYRWKCLK